MEYASHDVLHEVPMDSVLAMHLRMKRRSQYLAASYENGRIFMHRQHLYPLPDPRHAGRTNK